MSFQIGGKNLEDLQEPGVAASGQENGKDFWNFGRSKITGLRKWAGEGDQSGYAGYAENGDPWTSGPNQQPGTTASPVTSPTGSGGILSAIGSPGAAKVNDTSAQTGGSPSDSAMMGGLDSAMGMGGGMGGDGGQVSAPGAMRPNLATRHPAFSGLVLRRGIY